MQLNRLYGRSTKVAQLFGYNDSQFAPPALIFYDALVPVAHIFEQNQFSSLLYIYFEYQFRANHISSTDVDFCELWVQPRTGAQGRMDQLCKCLAITGT
uniref:Uncharacterized protein n=1 Tax=Moniliophthora roreri TaxID=221103 RepID=A0A0W0G9T4_MONRR